MHDHFSRGNLGSDWIIEFCIDIIQWAWIFLHLCHYEIAIRCIQDMPSFQCYFDIHLGQVSWCIILVNVIIPPETKFRGGILDSPCASVRLSVCPSVRPWVGVRMITLIFFSGFKIFFYIYHLGQDLAWD